MLFVIKSIVYLYSYLTLPLYFVIQRPWIKKREAKRIRAVKVDDGHQSESMTWVRFGPALSSTADGHETFNTFLDSIFKIYSNRKCLGFREVALEVEEPQVDGKLTTKKVLMSEYTWFTYGQIEVRVDALTQGFLNEGIKPKDVVIIFMETRLEWLISFMALNKLGATVATLYATLGEKAIIYAANLVEGSAIVTSSRLLKVIFKIGKKLEHLRTIVYVNDGQKVDGVFTLDSLSNSYHIRTLDEVEQASISIDVTPKMDKYVPKPDDTILIMFTSGSTGVPKGVTINQRTMVAAMKTMHCALQTVTQDDVHCAVLPLAHILELCMDLGLLGLGASVGYSSPYTLTDGGLALQTGCRGDAVVLKPTMMALVPVVLDKVKKGVLDKVKSRGSFFFKFFNFCMTYKKVWTDAGYDTPLLNSIVFKKMKESIGGNVRYIVVGGAPLSPETHSFIERVLCTKVIQGYGATETHGAFTVNHPSDTGFGHVGSVLSGAYLKLVPWEEGGYYPTDLPNPRGEILAGGDIVASGYFKDSDQTKAAFLEENGIRWFKTGDIGEVRSDGRLKIVDRAKDLVKLSHGEYVSLGKVESVLKGNEYVDNICLYGDSLSDHLVALLSPNMVKLKVLAKTLKKDVDNDKVLSSDPDIVNAVLESMRKSAAASNLNKYEVPRKIAICLEDWTPASGFLTAAMKLRRKHIYSYYDGTLKNLYLKDYSVV